MSKIVKLIVIALVLNACSGKESDKYPVKQTNWESKETPINKLEDYYLGKSYLPVYSHIYHTHEHRTFDLTITVSIRNISLTDSLYILKADYYNTNGDNIRQYIKNPIYLSPLETLEIIIGEKDIEGGSGANFLFDWAIIDEKNPPLFEAVMISTYGQQGISFTTRGVQIIE